MAETVTMPKLGFDMQEGTLANWVKSVGDTISQGDVIVEVETDKATVEVEAFTSGTLLKLLVEPGDIVEVGAPIAIVGEAGEDVSGVDVASSAPSAEEASTEDALEQPTDTPVAVGAAAADASAPGGVKASPIARRMANEKGFDLTQINGSGPGGRIIKRDVENFQPSATPKAAPSAAPAVAIGTAAPSYSIMDEVPHDEIDISRMRATIARRMVESKQFVPHFTVTAAMDTSELLRLRKQINAKLDDEHKVSVNDLIVKAVALTLVQFPNLNTHYHGDKFVRYNDINIGIAVALPNGGLINVVSKNANTMSLSAMAKKNKQMIAAAREGKVRPEDIEGSTFTVSNLGPFGVEHFTAIINPPEAGILAIGASQQTPVVNAEGEISIGNIMKVTVSVDHRVSDGAEGAQFVQYFKGLIEDPMRLLV